MDYSIKAGVTLSLAIKGKVEKIATPYFAATQHKFTVTSGQRSAKSQASAMYTKIAAGSKLTDYRDQTSAQAIKAAYDAGVKARQSRDKTVADMVAVIDAQIANGVYISKHLRDGAVDVRSRDMDETQRAKFKEEAEKVATSVLLEKFPPHWHLQF